VASQQGKKKTGPKPNTGGASKPQTFDRLKSHKGLVRQVAIYLDSEVADEYDAAKAELGLLNVPDVAKRTTEAQKQAAEARLEAAKTALDEATETVTLRRPVIEVPVLDADGQPLEAEDDEPAPTRTLKGRLAYEWLIDHNPASEEENAKHKEEHGTDAPYDADTFCPALVAACADNDLTAEQWDELFDEWNMNEVMSLFTACMEVCNSSSVGRLGKG
jgi:hypothetical protein